MMAGRLSLFKNKGKDSTGQRCKRTEFSIELRKVKKLEQTMKKRQCVPEDVNDEELQFWLIQKVIEDIRSEKLEVQLKATRVLRLYVCNNPGFPCNSVIDADLVSKCVHFMAMSDCPAIQFEASRVLVNVAASSTEHAAAVVEAGAVPHFVKMLSSPHRHLYEQGVWGLGNIAGEGPGFRDLVIKCGLAPLLTLAGVENLSVVSLRILTWALCNLCTCSNTPPPFHAVLQLIPALADILQHDDKLILSDTCWALSSLTNISTDVVETVVQIPNLVSRLIYLLSCEAYSVVYPALQVVGNISSYTDVQTQPVLDAGFLNVFPKLLSSPCSGIQLDAICALSNITAGGSSQIQEVIDAGLVPLLLVVLDQGDCKIRCEAAWAVSNIAVFGSAQQVAHLVSFKVLGPLMNMLSVKSNEITLITLEAVFSILKMAHDGDCEKICEMIDELDGWTKIEALQSHENEEISKISVSITELFFREQ